MPNQEHYPDGVDRWFGWQSDGKGHNDYEDACAEADKDAAERVERDSKQAEIAIRQLSLKAAIIRGMMVIVNTELSEIITALKDEADGQARSLLEIYEEVTNKGKHDVEIPYPRVNLAEILGYAESARDHISGDDSEPNAVECISALADVWHKTKG